MDAPGERIDLFFTTPKKCLLEKPRVLLGSCLMRWLHWRDGISIPCLRDYGQPCKPCGVQTEYAYLAAALVEPTKGSAKVSIDPRPARWAALPEAEKEAWRAKVRPTRGSWPVGSLDIACTVTAWPDDNTPIAGTHFAGRRIVQCVRGEAMAGFDLSNLRGLVVSIGSAVKMTRLSIQVEPLDDFDPQYVFDRRYGLHRLPKQQRQGGEPTVLPFRKAE